MSEISSFIASMKAALDLAKTILGSHDQPVVREKVIELQSQIGNAQASAVSAQLELSEAIRHREQLERELSDLKAWGAEKEQYRLRDICENPSGSAMVYAPKDLAASGGPDHYLCPNCFNSGSKSILQKETRTPGLVKILSCHRCGAETNQSGVTYRDTPRSSFKSALRR